MIRAQHLTKKFENIVAIDDLSLSVEEGEIFGLVGPDGAGKTTMMRLLTSIMDPDGGDALVVTHKLRIALSVGAEEQPTGRKVMHALQSNPHRLGARRIVSFSIYVAAELRH